MKDIKNKAKTAKVWFWFLAGVCLLEVCVNTFVTGINSTVSKNNYEKNDAVIAKIVREKEEDEAEGKINPAKQGRRVAIPTEEEVPAGRRTTPKYNVVK